MEYGWIVDLYKHYKYFHFFSICFGLGCGLALYRPSLSPVFPSFLALYFTIVFEIMGIITKVPAHTKDCEGAPYERGDIYWGFAFALFVAFMDRRSYHVYTMSYGCGIMVFAFRGAIRKYCALWEMRQRDRG